MVSKPSDLFATQWVPLNGTAYLFRRINSAVPVVVLGLIIVFTTTSEIVMNYGVFASE